MRSNIFVYERATGTVTLVSHNAWSPTRTNAANSVQPSISADGAFVTFQSAATLLTGQDDPNFEGFDVYLFERATGVRTLVSHHRFYPLRSGDLPSGRPFISADGAFVTFQSRANDVASRPSTTERTSFSSSEPRER